MSFQKKLKVFLVTRPDQKDTEKNPSYLWYKRHKNYHQM